ncbi:MAG TPA: ribosome biogenesis GTPase Der, partial [Nitriliruptorales bacterium]|nr:ribosome biogenesis GTPase Der [Nitriliruptorales bacterium]
MTPRETGRRGLVIAIDGPAGVGKSTVARELACRLDLLHVDTGALYRAVTLAVLRAGVDPDDQTGVERVARAVQVEHREGRTFLDGEDVEDLIREPDVTAAVSAVAAHPDVRAVLLPVQRAAATGGAVVEGRDIGAVVFPDAELKIWLTAREEERARRRAEQEGADDREAVARDLARRDARDTDRVVAPARQAEDAWELDTTAMTSEETVGAIADLALAVWRRQGRDDLVAVVQGADGRSEAADAPTTVAPSPDPAIAPAETALPRVAVVGRPNVGKSTFVNRAIARRAAIVEERPGVTRDRTEHVARWRDRTFLVVDTGGWRHRAEGMDARIVEQAEAAVAMADVVVLLVDVTVGALEDDERYARLLRRAQVPVLLVANKVDSPRQDPLVHELYALGLGEPLPVSAAHGRGMGDALDAIVAALPDQAPAGQPDASDVPRVAVVGRPNVGKSSLFNRLAGEERAIVDPVPHTTRDPVDTVVTIDGRPWRFVDTAGLRRRYRHGEETELYAVDRTRRAADRADLALFVVDG